MRSPRGASAEILRRARKRKVTLLMSVPLAVEYEAVCRRPEHRKAAGLTEAEVTMFLDAAIALAEPVEVHFLWRPQLRDAADEMVLDAAVNGGADAVVTFNHADFEPAAARFGVAVLPPREALKRMR